MLIYRFRVTCDDVDGFLREIEIQPGQTFLDFHHILIDSSELVQCDKASFFITDKTFRKDKEISLKPSKKQIRKYDEDIDQVVTESVSVPLMKNEKIKNYIEDPHQRLVYDFSGRELFTFHIELFKIAKTEEMVSFPRCIKSVGELPKKAAQPVVAASEQQPVKKEIAPKIILPPVESVAKLDHLVESDEELAAIEEELGGLMDDIDLQETGDEGADAETGSEYSYGEGEDEVDQEDLEHMDDFEDLESLDRRMSGYDRDPDDY